MLAIVMRHRVGTYINSSRFRESEVRSPSTRQVLLSKLSTSLVGTNPEELPIRSASGLRAACGGLEGGGRRVSSRARLALVVPLIDDSALVARDARLVTGEALTTALGPGGALGDREAGEETEGEEGLHDGG